jgi:tetratricopeptide (TPR) repeat protein
MSARTRIRLLVGLAALVAAVAAVAVVLVARGDGEAAGGPPPLELSLVVRDDPEARALRAAERAYDRGDRGAAESGFERLARANPSSLEAAVGAAIAAWPDGTVERLQALEAQHPGSALVHLHLGLALYSDGQPVAAAGEWRRAEKGEPDSPSAVRAADLLHPGMAPGLPSFFTDLPPPKDLGSLPPQRQLEELERRAQERGGVDDWILYGTALQRVGRPVSALAAFDRAAAAAPERLDAKVAAAVARFDKDDPSAAFSRLGPLARDNPDSALVRFHLGVLLLWIRDVKDARAQLRRAERAEPASLYGREAKDLLSRLEKVRT